MTNETKKTDDKIFIVKYTTIQNEKLRNREIVVRTTTIAAALDQAETKLKEAGITNFRVGTARPF